MSQHSNHGDSARAGPTVRSQVTKPIEDAVAGLGNIDNIISTVDDGVSTTTVNFLLGTDSDRATNDVHSGSRSELPQDINEPIVERLDFAGGPNHVCCGFTGANGRTIELLVDETISRALLCAGSC